MVWLSFPFIFLELSRSSASSVLAASAAFSAFLSLPYFLSEKYLVNVVPSRLRQRRHPWNAVVSYVKRVRFFLDFIDFS